MDKMVLELQTFPACSLGLNKFRKEILRVGHYIKESTEQEFDITIDVLNHLVETFGLWVAGGNRVSIPLGHERAHLPEFNRGWVESLFIEGNALFAIMELSDPKLALTTDVSVCIDSEFTDGHGTKYSNVLTHVALTTSPVVGGLSNFVKLSLSKGANSMSILKKLAKKLGITDAEPTEDAVVLALETKLKDTSAVVKKVELSVDVDPLTKLVGENRDMKLSNFVKAGLITPAIKDIIAARYVETKALTLELSSKVDTGFDFLCEILTTNKPVNLDEVSGVQNIELANGQVAQPNAMQKVIAQKRTEAGLKN